MYQLDSTSIQEPGRTFGCNKAWNSIPFYHAGKMGEAIEMFKREGNNFNNKDDK